LPLLDELDDDGVGKLGAFIDGPCEIDEAATCGFIVDGRP